MADRHPVESLIPIEQHFPAPGTKEPFAVIRWVHLTVEGEPASRWRVVTFKEPRRLIGQGYFIELEQAALEAHRAAVAAAGGPELSSMDAYDPRKKLGG